MALVRSISYVAFLLAVFAGSGFSESVQYHVGYEAVLKADFKDSSYWIELAENVTGMKAQVTAPLDSVETGLERLKLSGWFGNVSLETTEKAGYLESKFVIAAPPLLIEDVMVENPAPLFEEEILKSISLKSGDLLQAEKLKSEKIALPEYLSEEGVRCDSIQVMVLPGDLAHTRKVVFQLVNAKTFRIKKFDIIGIGWWKSFIFKNKVAGFQRAMDFIPGKRFRSKILDKEIRELKEDYLERGYYDVTLDKNIELDSSEMEVYITLDVHSGKKYKIDIKGNTHVKKLKKQLAFDRGNKRNIGFKKSLNQIKDYCQNHGFLHAKVSGKIDSSGSKKKISILVDEGKQYIVDRLTLEGVSPQDSLELLKRLLHQSGPFHPSFLYEDKLRIAAYFLEQGYANTKVDTAYTVSNSKRKNHQIPINVGYVINPGSREIIKHVSYTGFPDNIQKILYDGGKEPILNKPFNYKTLLKSQNNIGIKLSELGYPHSEVHFEKEKWKDSSEIHIKWDVVLGPKVHFGKLYVKGHFKTKPKVLQRELEMKQGDPFSLIKTLESQRNWQNLGLFNNIELNTLGLLEKRDSVHLMLSLAERKTEYLKLKIGYESDRGGFLESQLGNENMWGLNKHGWFHSSLSHRDIDEIKWEELGWGSELGISDPAFMDFNVYASFIAGYYRKLEVGKKFFEESFYSSVNFHKPIWKFIETGVGLEYELRRAEGLASSVDSSYRNNILLGPYTKIDTRNSFIRPIRGIYTRFGMDFSLNLDGFEKDNFVRYSWVGKTYYTPIPFLTFAAELNTTLINDSSLAVDQKAYLGGSSNVRGYIKNGMDPAGGNISVSGSLELRWEFLKNLESVFFVDAGFLKNHPDPIPYFTDNLNELKWTPGLGLNYITPIGPVGIHYGHRLNPIEYGAWHFLIGYSI